MMKKRKKDEFAILRNVSMHKPSPNFEIIFTENQNFNVKHKESKKTIDYKIISKA